MESIVLHLAIDSFAIQAERMRCPKLVGRPVALATADSSRPRVLASSREAAACGVAPGLPLVVARRICRDLIALPPDGELYAGLSDSIRNRLLPFAPLGGAPKPGRFVLDLTGLAQTHADACGRASRVGREVEGRFGLHPTLGVGATRLVSGIAAGVLAPDGELLDVPAGSEAAFLGPLPARVLPTARGRLPAERLDLLAVRLVRDLQALGMAELTAALGRAAAFALWRESRGLDGAVAHPSDRPPTAVAEETLAQETNDRRALAARVARLAMEVGVGIRRRGTAARRLEVGLVYADGQQGRARMRREEALSQAELGAAALHLLDRALTRRIRVRRIRLAAWEEGARAEQLLLWSDPPPARAAFDAALEKLRARLGTGAVVPASWMALGVAVRPSPRP